MWASSRTRVAGEVSRGRSNVAALLVCIAASALLSACAAGEPTRHDGGESRDVGEPSDARDASPTACRASAECSDSIACTIDECTDATCAHRPCIDCCEAPLTCVLGVGCTRPPRACTTDADCADGVRCTLDACSAGFCTNMPQDALCSSGEICRGGCIPARGACSTVDDCIIARPCDGQWQCVVEFGCEYLGPTSCDDGDACTADSCVDPGGCTHTPTDVDADGHAPVSCGGADCDDADPAIHPGAAEVCDGADNDCDTAIDESVCIPCPSGFSGRDGDCTDIDECAMGLCGAAATGCSNTPGSYACTCAAGYTAPPTGGTCEDVDECTTAVCGTAALDCTNTPGSYVCACMAGYAAPAMGGTCADVDECATGICGPQAAGCANTPGSYACTCMAGYTAPPLGGMCTLTDACAAGGTDCDTDPAAACASTGGATYTCTCPPDFVGTGHGSSGCLLADPSLISLVPSAGSLDPAFASGTTTYRLGLPPGATTVTLTPTVSHPTHATITIDGATVASGAPSAPIALTGFAPRLVSVTVTTDSGAVRTYTVTVVRTSVYIKASNTDVGDRFGSLAIALSADGSTLAVAAEGEGSSARGVGGDPADNGASGSGAVYVFVRSASGWAQQAYIKASNTDAFDSFGHSIALSSDGSTLAVGAVGEDSSATGINGDQADNSANSAGAVYVFRRSGTTWTQQAYIKASNTDPNDSFGWAVALSSDGSTLAVGALGEDSSATGVGGNQADNTGGPQAGAAYVFVRSGVTWTQQAYIKASNTEARDSFGHALALSADGSTMAVGAWGEDSSATGIGGNQADNAAATAGAVYVFVRSGVTWTQQAYVKSSNTDAGDSFGMFGLSLSADGSTLAVGATGEDSNATGVGGNQADNSASASGAVYVFRRIGTTWTQQAYIKAPNTDAGDIFGVSVALSGDGAMLAIGATGEDSSARGIGGDQASNTLSSAGAAYVFSLSGSTWSLQAYIKASNPDASDAFGPALALSADGSTLAVGAGSEDSSATGIGGDESDNSAMSAGAAYVF